MVRIHELKPDEGSRKKRKRVGRGTGSGYDKTSGRGHKGQKARSGGRVRPGFEGGQMPLYRRLPKRGFTHQKRREYEIVNVEELNRFETGADVTPERLTKSGLTSGKQPVKILGKGDLKKALTVKADRFSRGAREKIEQAGGQIQVMEA